MLEVVGVGLSLRYYPSRSSRPAQMLVLVLVVVLVLGLSGFENEDEEELADFWLGLCRAVTIASLRSNQASFRCLVAANIEGNFLRGFRCLCFRV